MVEEREKRGRPTSRPKDVIHVTGVPMAFLFFKLFRLRVLYWMQTKEQKKGWPGNEASAMIFCSFNVQMSKSTGNFLTLRQALDRFSADGQLLVNSVTTWIMWCMYLCWRYWKACSYWCIKHLFAWVRVEYGSICSPTPLQGHVWPLQMQETLWRMPTLCMKWQTVASSASTRSWSGWKYVQLPKHFSNELYSFCNFMSSNLYLLGSFPGSPYTPGNEARLTLCLAHRKSA